MRHRLYPPNDVATLPDDWPAGVPMTLSLGLYVSDILLSEMAFGLANIKSELEAIFDSEPFNHGSQGVLWLDYRLESQNSPNVLFQLVTEPLEQRVSTLNAREREVLATIVRTSNLGVTADPVVNMATLLRALNPWRFMPPVTHLVADRKMTATPGGGIDDIDVLARSGTGLISGLQRLGHPDSMNRKRDLPRYEAINRFIADVLDDPEAQIDTNSSGS